MSEKLQQGMTLPDFELPDENGDMHRLSELQGDDPMILLLGRGEHCPRERQHQKELIKLYEWCAVGFASMVTILPNDQHETYKLKISTPATWTYLSDEALEVQRTLGIDEYTDPHHNATVPHTLVLAPGWRPRFVDYRYTSYTNATAFSPTDTLPLTPMAKLLMAAQSLIAVTTILLVVARAVNVLG